MIVFFDLKTKAFKSNTTYYVGFDAVNPWPAGEEADVDCGDGVAIKVTNNNAGVVCSNRGAMPQDHDLKVTGINISGTDYDSKISGFITKDI